MFFAFAAEMTDGIVDGSMPVRAMMLTPWAIRLLPQVAHFWGDPWPSQ